MALPEDERREQERRRIELERRSDIARGGGVWYAWWWVWFVIIIGFLWFVGWGWGGYGGWWWGQPRNAVVIQTPAGSGVQVLNASNKLAFVGQPFVIRRVPVQGKISGQSFWIGGNGSTPMLVVLEGNGNTTANANINPGDRVNITGTVEKAPPAAEAKKSMGLDDNAVKRLEQEGVYAQATQVQRVNNLGRTITNNNQANGNAYGSNPGI